MNIVISGTVGIGKSTISKKLTKHLKEQQKDVFLVEELQKEDPFLDKYYENRAAWSFLIQINFVMDRFNKVYAHNKNKGIVIFDRHFLDDYIFSSFPVIKNDMNNLTWNAYSALNYELKNKIDKNYKVDYFFLLKADFEKIIKRIDKRGRASEKEVDLDYWKKLYDHYYNNQEIRDYILTSVNKFIIIDANTNDINKIVENILQYLR